MGEQSGELALTMVLVDKIEPPDQPLVQPVEKPSNITSDIADIKMVSIHGGSFRMGDLQNYRKDSDEKPVHDVTLSGFDMSIYEITQGNYKALIGSNPSYFSGSDDLPVEKVSWEDAVIFCNKLSEQAGYEKCYNENSWACDFSKNGYRLPTEAEWEYACKAGTETKF